MLKGKKQLILFLLIFSYFNFFYQPQYVNAAIEVNSPIVISSDSTFIFETYHIYNDIIIQSYVNVSFLGCVFIFLNETDPNKIMAESHSNVTFHHCKFYGSDSEYGNSWIDIDYAKMVRFINCEFYNTGCTYAESFTIKARGSITEHTELLIIDSIFNGTRASIKLNDFNRTLIQNSNFSNINIYTTQPAIELHTGFNTEIKGCRIEGYWSGIYGAYEKQLKIHHNKFVNQNGPAGSFLIGYFINPDEFANISYNEIEGSSYGFTFSESPYTHIINNTLKTLVNGLTFNIPAEDKGFNYTIVNNTFSNSDLTKNNNFIDIEGYMINWTLLDNRFEFFGEDFQPNIFGSDFLIDIKNLTTNQSNKINNRTLYFFTCEEDYSKTLDFSGYEDSDIGGMIFFNYNGSKITNLNINNLTCLSILNSKDLIFDQVNLTNIYSRCDIKNSFNVTIQNSTFLNEITKHWVEFLLYYSDNVTISNSSFTNLFYDLNAHAITMYYAQNCSIENCSFNDIYNYAIYSQYSNDTIIKNNTFHTKGGIMLIDCYDNIIQFNEFIPYVIKGDLKTNILNSMIIGSYECLEYNLYDYNHWIKNILAVDENKDGISDTELIVNENLGVPYVIDYHPLFIDSDDDGLDDLQEIYYESDPYNQDTDSDYINDFEEVRTYNSNPNNQDSDFDQILDYEEIFDGLDGYITNATNPDTDGDLFSDYEEIMARSDPTNPLIFPGGFFNEDNSDENNQEESFPENTLIIPGTEILIGTAIALTISIYTLSRLSEKKKKKYVWEIRNPRNYQKKSISEDDKGGVDKL